MRHMYQKINGSLQRVGNNIGRRLYQKVNGALTPVQSLWCKTADGGLEEIELYKYIISSIEFPTSELLSCTTLDLYHKFVASKIPGVKFKYLDDATFVYDATYGISCQYGSCVGTGSNSGTTNCDTNTSNCVLFTFSASKITNAEVNFYFAQQPYAVSNIALFAKDKSENCYMMFSIYDGSGLASTTGTIYYINTCMGKRAVSESMTLTNFSCIPSGEYTYYFCSAYQSDYYGNQPTYMSYLKLEFE